jgi:AraC-like DNA-binding protein
MTAGANRLTPRANGADGTAVIGGTVPAGGVRVLVGALECLGHDTEGLLAAAGLRPADLIDPDGRVPCTAYGALLACAQQRRFTPNLALRLAQQIPIGAFPLLDYLVLTSDSVGAGVRQLARYLRLVGNPVSLDLRESAEPIEVRTGGDDARFASEYTIALAILHLRAETDGRFAPDVVWFSHEPDDASDFGRLLGCAVRGGAPWSGMSVSRDAWRLPLRRRDPVLRGVLERQAEEIAARLPAQDGFVSEVRRALASRVARGDTRIEAVARLLATSARTLQRRLAERGTSHQQLLDEARREAAGQHLVELRLSISEVAYLLGYSEPAPFHRAFKRWYGVTPHAFRRARGASEAGTAAVSS